MGQSSSERAWASRARRSKNLSPEGRERLDRYNRSRGRPGRPSIAPPAPAAAAAPPVPLQEPPAPESPPSGVGGQGGGPPIDLGAPPANDQAGAGPDAAGAEDEAARKAAERLLVIKAASAYIVQLLRDCEPIIRQAQIPLPPLPELVLAVTGKCWEITLTKWLPEEIGDPKEHAELVACATTGYQLGATFWARKRLEARILEVPAVDAAPASSSSSAPPPAPPPPATSNGVAGGSKSIFAAAIVPPPKPAEAKS